MLVGKRVGFLREVCRGVDAFQRQPAVRRQVVHGAAHAVDGAPRCGHLSRRLPLERGVTRGELEVRGRDGKRRAQLVHDLLEQLALLFSTGVETVEHVVHAGSETSELVVARLELDTLPRLGAIDAVDDVGDLLDRSQHLSGDEPGERRRRYERDRDRGEHPAQTVTPRPVCGRGRVLRGDLHEGDAIADLLHARDRDGFGLVAEPSAEEEPGEPDERRGGERKSRHPESEPPAQGATAACGHAAARSR